MPISSNLSQGSSSTGSITERAVRVISNFSSKFGLRNAVRYNPVLNHRFEPSLLVEFTFCSQCSLFIYGLVGQACRLCKLVSHKKCLHSIKSSCVRSPSDPFQNPKPPIHQFKANTFLLPTYCNHCGVLITGFRKQGLKCDNDKCRMNVHFDCEELVCRPCCEAVDQKITSDNSSNESNRHNNRTNWAKISIQDFDLLRIIGTGSFSKVYLAKLRQNQQEFAIKVVKKTNVVVSSDPESVLTEMKVLNFGRQYPFLAIAHCCFQSEERLYFVMEHIVGRDLFYHLCEVKVPFRQRFTEDRARFYSAEIVLALRFLHKQGVVYRDLKLENVIVEKHGHCKLLDFGMSKVLNKTGMTTRTFCGTPSYISPEVIRELNYGFSVDWWALGVLTYEMLVGHPPFMAESEDQLYQLIVDESVTYPPEVDLSTEAKHLLQGLLTKDPQTRLGCHIVDGCEQAVLEHPFFLFTSADGIYEGYQWEALETKRIKPPYRPTLDELETPDDWVGEQAPSLTPIEARQLKEISQAEFNGFSFYSDSFTSMVGLN